MRRRIFWSICAVALISVVAMSILTVFILYHATSRSAYTALETDATYLAAVLAEENVDGEAYLVTIRGTGDRITLVSPAGAVLFDSREDPAKMENHVGRPEIAAALEMGEGRAQRNSATLNERTLYYARRLPDGGVLRLSSTVDGIWTEVLRVLPLLLIVIAGVVLLAGVVARRQSKRILEPINEIELDAPLSKDVYDELAPLLRRIEAQRAEIDTRVRELKARQGEFSAITQSMAEGLLLLNAGGRILFANASACRILDLRAEWENPPLLLEACRDETMAEIFQRARGGEVAAGLLERGGRQYRVSANTAGSEGGDAGVILLLTDDTERLQAEQLRRQFAANVSHELKTPLTSISGYAELIENGLAKPEDTAGFAGRIRTESQRLIALIGDIIRLSRLDEGACGEREPVDLLALGEEIRDQLHDQAAEKDIKVTLSGGPEIVQGVRTILAEAVYNLLDNAIRYTPGGGRVTIAVGREEGEITLAVRDSGPGIAERHRERVFERFYRVDKSHSRQSGGTGLGLAIVKHGMQVHNGRVELKSGEGRGSVFILRFHT